MPDRLVYASGKFREALRSLAAAGDIHTRVYWAWSAFATLRDTDYRTPELMEIYRDIMEHLDRVPDKDMGSVKASLDAMPASEAEYLAGRIVDLALAAEDELRDERHK